MSSESLNIMRRSYVREQACLPLRLPERAWVCNDGAKGFLESLSSNLEYGSLICGFFFAIFFACLRYRGEYSISRFIKYCFYGIFHRFKFYRLFFFSLQHPLFKSLPPALFVKQICSEIPDFNKGIFREPGKYFLNIIELGNSCMHENIIAYSYEAEWEIIVR